MSRRFLVLFVSALALLGVFAGQAAAAPGAYRVLLAEINPEGAKKLGAQLATFPEVATIDYVDTGTATPSASALVPYDVVVSIGDNGYDDVVAWGNSLAAYVDQGGVVVQSAYDTWYDPGAFPQGAFSAGDYSPFIPGDNVNNSTTLGAYDPADPLMQGITSLASEGYNTENVLSPGAKLVASWADGLPAVAVKGRVVATSAMIGDGYGPEAWSGDFGRLVVNAVRTLGSQLLSVSVFNPAGGTVTSSAGGLNCGTICAATLPSGTAVSLEAVAAKNFVFGGFGGACTGTSCALTMEGGSKAVTATFVAFKPNQKVKLNKAQGKGTLTLYLGGSGKLVLSGKKVKKQTKSPKAAGKVKLPIVAKGKARTQLKNTGKTKVKLQLAYTPTGGIQATLKRSVVLKLNP